MPKPFDPHHRWLGIPPSQQPPDHYRLLGLQRFEDDVDVIRDSAERQISHVRRYALGEHREECQQLLTDLGRAKAVLLVDSERAAYDRQLRRMTTRGIESTSLHEGKWRVRTLAPWGIAFVATVACVYLLQGGGHRDEKKPVSIATVDNSLESERDKASVEVPHPETIAPDDSSSEDPALAGTVAGASARGTEDALPEVNNSPAPSGQNAIMEAVAVNVAEPETVSLKEPEPSPLSSSAGADGEVENTADTAIKKPPILGNLVSLKAHVGKTRSVAPSPSGDVLASTGDDQRVRVWNVKDRSSMTVSEAATGEADYVAFSPTQDLLAVWKTGDVDETGAVTLWDLRERRIVDQLRGDGAVVGVEFSPNGKFVGCLFGDEASREVAFWAPWTDRQTTSFLLSRAGDLTRRRYTGTTRYIGASRKKQKRRTRNDLLDAPDEMLPEVPPAEEESAAFTNTAAFCFSPTGRFLAASTESGDVMFADLIEQKILGPLRAEAKSLTDVTFNGDESLIASTSMRSDESLLLWQMSNLNLATALTTDLTNATAISWSPVSNLFATGSSDGRIRLWDANTRRQINETEPNGHSITDIAFFPDGSKIAAGDAGGNVSLWRVGSADRADSAGPPSTPRSDMLDRLAKSLELRDLKVSVTKGSRNVFCHFVLKSTLPDHTSVPRDPFDGSYTIARCVCRVGKYHSTVRYIEPGPEIAASGELSNSFTAFLREKGAASQDFTVEFQTRWGETLQTKTIEFDPTNAFLE